LRESEGERERVAENEREREGPAPTRLLPSLCRAYVCSYARPFVLLSIPPSLPSWGPGHPFYRCKEMPSCTMGCSWELMWLAGKCPEPCIDNNVAVEGTSRVL
jgi:hypothetical protein